MLETVFRGHFEQVPGLRRETGRNEASVRKSCAQERTGSKGPPEQKKGEQGEQGEDQGAWKGVGKVEHRGPIIKSLDFILNAMGGLQLSQKHWSNLHFHSILDVMWGMDGRGRCLSPELSDCSWLLGQKGLGTCSLGGPVGLPQTQIAPSQECITSLSEDPVK